MVIRVLYILLFLVGNLYSGFSQDNDLFNQGKDAYKRGDYQEAIDNWSRILNNDKHSAALYFNLGNAHYKMSQIGPSIYYYEKALQLDPNDKDIRNNLSFAENARIDIIEPLPKTVFARWYERGAKLLSYEGWAVGCCGLFLSGCCVVLTLLFLQLRTKEAIVVRIVYDIRGLDDRIFDNGFYAVFRCVKGQTGCYFRREF